MKFYNIFLTEDDIKKLQSGKSIITLIETDCPDCNQDIEIELQINPE